MLVHIYAQGAGNLGDVTVANDATEQEIRAAALQLGTVAAWCTAHLYHWSQLQNHGRGLLPPVFVFFPN